MFSGDWHGIMYEAAAVTTEASQLWFTAYDFLLTVFCNNLLVGVVMAQYAEVDTPYYRITTIIRAAQLKLRLWTPKTNQSDECNVDTQS